VLLLGAFVRWLFLSIEKFAFWKANGSVVGEMQCIIEYCAYFSMGLCHSMWSFIFSLWSPFLKVILCVSVLCIFNFFLMFVGI